MRFPAPAASRHTAAAMRIGALLCVIAGLPVHAGSQQMQAGPSPRSTALLPQGTPLEVQVQRRTPLRRGQRITARLMYPVFQENELALPAGTIVSGRIVGLQADHAHRVEARLRGDFTPFHKAVVQFDEVHMADGTAVAISTEPTADGAKLVQLMPSPKSQGSFVRRMWNKGLQTAKDRLRVVTAPGKADRLQQLLYAQLPYHPQSVASSTTWNVELAADVRVPSTTASRGGGAPTVADAPPSSRQVSISSSSPSEPSPADQAIWTITAYLAEPLSSATAKAGEPIRAVVAEPVRNPDGSIAVQQGAELEGTVTRARPARRFGRAGVLQFHFRELREPGALTTTNVQASLAGISATSDSKLAMDSEGNVKPKPPGKVLVPLILFSLARRPLDEDGSTVGKNAVSSNSLGLAGFLVGTAGGWSNVAAGIGFYGTAVSLYERWIRRGAETEFPRNTRVIVQTSQRHNAPMPKEHR